MLSLFFVAALSALADVAPSLHYAEISRLKKTAKKVGVFKTISYLCTVDWKSRHVEMCLYDEKET